MGGMVEVVAIFACLGWLVALFCGWLSSLPFFPALVTGAIGLPLLAAYDYCSLGRRCGLRGWRGHRVPVPPGHHHRGRDDGDDRGWANALAGTWTGARLLSSTSLFIRASQWFDAMSPNVVGLLRRTMYRLSDNYEYLGEQRRDPEKERVY